jgi:hypothetical protein
VDWSEETRRERRRGLLSLAALVLVAATAVLLVVRSPSEAAGTTGTDLADLLDRAAPNGLTRPKAATVVDDPATCRGPCPRASAMYVTRRPFTAVRKELLTRLAEEGITERLGDPKRSPDVLRGSEATVYVSAPHWVDRGRIGITLTAYGR